MADTRFRALLSTVRKLRVEELSNSTVLTTTPLVIFAPTYNSDPDEPDLVVSNSRWGSWHETDGDQVEIRLLLDQPAPALCSVTVNVNGATSDAIDTEHYINSGFFPRVVTFNPGEQEKTISFLTVDQGHHIEKNIDLHLSSGSGCLIPGAEQGDRRRVHFMTTETPPVADLDGVALNLGTGGGSSTIGVVLDKASRDPVIITASVSNDPSNLVTVGALTIAAGATTGNLPITVAAGPVATYQIQLTGHPPARVNRSLTTDDLTPEDGFPWPGENGPYAGTPSSWVYSGDNNAPQSDNWHLAVLPDTVITTDIAGEPVTGIVLDTTGSFAGRCRKSFGPWVEPGGPDSHLDRFDSTLLACVSCYMTPYTDVNLRAKYVALGTDDRNSSPRIATLSVFELTVSGYIPRPDLSDLHGGSMGITADGRLWNTKVVDPGDIDHVSNTFFYPSYVPGGSNPTDPTITLENQQGKGTLMSRPQNEFGVSVPSGYQSNFGVLWTPKNNHVIPTTPVETDIIIT